jgi:transcriptional regulator with XRE-family HTH domain
MASTSYAEVITRNIRAARARAGLDQAEVVARMRSMGYDTWHRQTMGKVERGERKVAAEEIIGLSEALDMSIAELMAPIAKDKMVSLPSGALVSVEHVQRSVSGLNDHEIVWSGHDAVFPGPGLTQSAARARYESLSARERSLIDRIMAGVQAGDEAPEAP